jgi:hypothetical protein
MTVLAGHDVEGNIHYVVVSPADAPPATVTTTETGLLVTEVEAAQVISGLSDPKDSQRQLGEVLQYLQDFRVEVGKAKLVRKQSKQR